MPIKRSRTKSRNRKRGGGNKNGTPSVASNMKETNAPPGLNAPSVLPEEPLPEEQLEASLAKEPPPEASLAKEPPPEASLAKEPPPEEQLEASLAKEPPPEAPGGAELQNRARHVAPSTEAPGGAELQNRARNVTPLPVEPQNEILEQSSGTSNAVEITGKALNLTTAADKMARELKTQEQALVNKAVGNIIGGSYSKKHRKHKSKSRRRPTRMNKSPRMNKSTRMNKSKKYKKSRRRRR